MFEFAFAGRQSLGDLVEAVGPSQLAEQHSDELAPAGKPTGVPLRLMLVYCSFELGARK